MTNEDSRGENALNANATSSARERWKVMRAGHITATARADSWLEGELRSSSSKNRLTVSLSTFACARNE